MERMLAHGHMGDQVVLTFNMHHVSNLPSSLPLSKTVKGGIAKFPAGNFTRQLPGAVTSFLTQNTPHPFVVYNLSSTTQLRFPSLTLFGNQCISLFTREVVIGFITTIITPVYSPQ